MAGSASKPGGRPYDPQTLERAALHYVGRYATTRAKLAAYLKRKLRERGWAGETAPQIDSLIKRFSDRGYVNDAVFAQARTESLLRRGYGSHRIEANLRAAGIDAATADGLRGDIAEAAERSAMAFAKRRKIGPFAGKRLNPEENRRAFAAMLRAGHGFEVARRILGQSAAGDNAEEDIAWDDFSGNADSR